MGGVWIEVVGRKCINDKPEAVGQKIFQNV